MSMLAERRRKTKWVINPTKKPIWTTDSEGIKLGKQLMEKMGWSAGKGLGANEQGIQEPLKVSYKNDTKGMGFKGNDEDWIEHQDEFNSLLSQLSSSDPSRPAEVVKSEIKSLEEKSKHSRARVHYQKFTRGKDLSRYTETDLACILGISHNKKRKNSLEEKSPVEGKKDGNYETSFGVTTINSGSIQDYFKKKWTISQSKENNSSKTSNEGTENTLNSTEECADISEHKKSKKRKFNELDADSIQVPEAKAIKTLDELENSEVTEDVKKNRKSKKRKLNEFDGEDLEVCENGTVDASGEVENSCDFKIEKESKKHKKSKKKKKEEINIESESVSKARKKEKCDVDNSNQIEDNNRDAQVTGGVENVSGDNDLSLDNKKYESLQLCTENSVNGDENFARKRKKDKKKHKIKELDELEENIKPIEEGFDHKIKKKKKKDKERKEAEHITQYEMEEVSDENCSDKDRHKSSLTENDESRSISNGDENIQKLNLTEDTTSAEGLESEKSRKEKKSKKKHKLDKPKLESDEEQKMECKMAGEEVESKSKKKKKKEKLSDQSLLENEETQEIKTESELVEIEPVVKEKKKKGKYKVDQSKEENEAETKSASEESKIKEKKKKEKHGSDQSGIENEKEQVRKSKRTSEETEPKVNGKVSENNKLGETKKLKYKKDGEGVYESNINSETVEETNDTSAIQKESERLKKAEVDTKLKEDCKKLGKGDKSKKDESKTENSNRIHSHKFELFKKKNDNSVVGKFPNNTGNNRVMGLIFGAEFDKFKGANVEDLVGYGMQKKIQGKGDG